MNKESRTDESSPGSAGNGHRRLGVGLQEMVSAGASKLWTHLAGGGVRPASAPACGTALASGLLCEQGRELLYLTRLV